MIRYDNGTVFNAGTQALVNAVNCVGVMGAGLALEFKLRFPDMFVDYQRRASQSSLAPGTLHWYSDQSGVSIVNFPTKNHFREPSRLEWIEQGLRDFVCTYNTRDISSVAFPALGTGYGGLSWGEVQPLMEAYLKNLNLDVVICLDKSPDAEGIEKLMLDWFNVAELDELVSGIKLARPQRCALEQARPYKRFRDIQKTKGIGSRTYARVFTYVYEKVKNDQIFRVEQLKLLW